MAGEFDYVTCAGNCTGTYNETNMKITEFPGVTDLEVHLQPNTGHALTVAKNATGGYEAMFAFLAKRGL